MGRNCSWLSMGNRTQTVQMIKIHHHLDYEFLMFIIGTTGAAQCPFEKIGVAASTIPSFFPITFQ
jgi:hypothetical protein